MTLLILPFDFFSSSTEERGKGVKEDSLTSYVLVLVRTDLHHSCGVAMICPLYHYHVLPSRVG